MAKKKNKYYVVLKGRQPGVYADWDACKAQIDGFAGAKFKSFENETLAKEAYRAGFFPSSDTPAPAKAVKPLKKITPFNPESISVDAACSGNPGLMEYRGIDNRNKQEIFHFGPEPYGTNNIGEFLAIVHALALLQKHNSNLPVYSDSKIAMNWVKLKKVKTNLERNAKTENLWRMIDRAIFWLETHTYANKILKWETEYWGENPADFGRK